MKKKEIINKFVNRILSLKPKKIEFIKLFGSYSRSQAKRESDIDLLICMNNFKKSDIDKLSDLSFDFVLDYRVLFSPIIYSLKEWNKELKAQTPFIKNVLIECIDLWKKRKNSSAKR